MLPVPELALYAVGRIRPPASERVLCARPKAIFVTERVLSCRG